MRVTAAPNSASSAFKKGLVQHSAADRVERDLIPAATALGNGVLIFDPPAELVGTASRPVRRLCASRSLNFLNSSRAQAGAGRTTKALSRWLLLVVAHYSSVVF
jgi:hypothetical protein